MHDFISSLLSGFYELWIRSKYKKSLITNLRMDVSTHTHTHTGDTDRRGFLNIQKNSKLSTQINTTTSIHLKGRYSAEQNTKVTNPHSTRAVCFESRGNYMQWPKNNISTPPVPVLKLLEFYIQYFQKAHCTVPQHKMHC